MKIDANLGKVGITVGGEWTDKTLYERLTIVSRHGSSYLSKTTNKGNDPESDTDNWMLIASKGDKGEDGSGSGEGGGTISIGVDFDTDGYLYWVVNGVWLLDPNGNKVRAQGIDGESGGGSGDGSSAFKSIVFLRSNTTPVTPTGGSFLSPVPSGWNDGIPQGEEKLWMSSRWFYSDPERTATTSWSVPAQATDTSEVDIEFSAIAENPGSPTSAPTNWHNEGVTGDIWMAVRIKRNGVWGPWSIAKIKGEDGRTPNAAFKSIVFKRSNAASVDAPSATSGSYASPVPYGWSDGIPSGDGKIWMSTRIFSSDGLAPQQAAWTTPEVVADNEYMDYEFSSVANPGTPSKATPASAEQNPNWTNSADATTIWMAMRKVSNGSYVTGSSWQVVKIKGENGKDGTSVTIKGKLTDTSQLPSSGNVAGDGYLIDGELWVWDGDSWENVGKIKGEDGTPGLDGRSPFVHIKYSNDGGTTFTDNDGETPGDYIGIYVDYISEDSSDVSMYQPWNKITGEDGFGYEYIFQLSSSATAPNVPTAYSDVDDFVPTGWTDNPGGVTSVRPYCWMCWRQKVDGSWSEFQGTNGKARLFSHYGEDGRPGDDGQPGDDGRGIVSITAMYLATNSVSGVTRSTTGWTSTIQTIGPNKKYLWRYEITEFDDNTSSETDPVIIGVYGSGRGISSVDEYYGVSSSTSEQPYDWDSTPPTIDAVNKYLWNYETINYDDGTYDNTDPIILNVYSEGRGISRIIEYYLATNASSGVTRSTSGWGTTVQSPSANARYLWNYEEVEYTDDTSSETDPVIIGVYVVPAYADDVQFLKGLFGEDEVLDEYSGAVLSSVLGVMDDSGERVVAMLNGSTDFYDNRHGTLMIAAGLPNGVLSYDRATFQVYEDGHVVLHDVVGVDVDMSGHVNATSGKIGSFDINSDGTISWSGNVPATEYSSEFGLSPEGMSYGLYETVASTKYTVGYFNVGLDSSDRLVVINTQTDGVTPLWVSGNRGEDAITVGNGDVTIEAGDLYLQHGSVDVYGDVIIGTAGRIRNFRLNTGVFDEGSSSPLRLDNYPSYQNYAIYRSSAYTIQLPSSPTNGDEYTLVCTGVGPTINLNGKSARLVGHSGSSAEYLSNNTTLTANKTYKLIYDGSTPMWLIIEM